ncbi:MAG: ATP-binding protein [Defluviitaleaceae bacterium]|nr:ATP-binding protein [Defluviitaleaceae bacterium]
MPITRFINNLSVKSKFILILIIVIGAATWTVAWIRANQVQDQVESSITERLQHNSAMSVGIVNTVRIYTLWILDFVATMPQVQNSLVQGGSEVLILEETLFSLFTSINRSDYNSSSYANIFVFDSNFNLVVSADPMGEFVDLSNGIFSENLFMAQKGLPFTSPVVKSPTSGLMQFLFTQPVLVDYSLYGIVAILGNIQILEQFLQEPTYDYDSFINIADSEGTIFFSNRLAYVGRHLDDLGVYEAFGFVPLDTAFHHNSAITGIDKIAYVTVETELGWTVVSFFDADAIESTSWVIFISLLPTIVGLTLAAALMVLMIHWSLNPLIDLTATAKKVAGGSLKVDFNIRRNDEIGQVFQSFLEIVTALNILKDNFVNAENAMTQGGTPHKLKDSRLGGVFDELFTRTNNIIEHMQLAKLEAESASKAKSEFLSKMSHEIRTPMNAIIGMSEIILRENLSHTARDQAATIKQSGNHLLSIINDILDLSKVESGKLKITNVEYLFHSTIHDVINMVKMRMSNPEVQFVVYMGHDIPNELFGDEVRLRQILINILANAVKYTQKGHISLDISGKKANDDTLLLTIKIKDTGIGIKPEDIDNLFCEFAQFDLEKNQNVEGTGLGLHIAKSLITLMGGEVEVNSVYGEGSEFVISLPQKYGKVNYETPSFANINVLLYCRTPLNTEYITRSLQDLNVTYCIVSNNRELHDKLVGEWDFIFAEADLAYAANHMIKTRQLSTKIVMLFDSYDAAYTVRDGHDFSILIMPAYFISIVNILSGGDIGYSEISRQPDHFIALEANILLVDDIDTNLKVGQGLLRLCGLDVDTCTGGESAIEAVLAKDYDLVFMDHMMPGMDGVEAVKVIRDYGDKYANLPIVALTANAIVGAREMFLQNGFDDFLSKPIEINKLNSILAKWIPKEKQKQPDSIQANNYKKTEFINIIIEDVNIQKGIMLSGGSIENYLDTLKVFHKDGLMKMNELINCLKNNNITLYATYIHALKSACANIGAEKLSEEAKVLEASGLMQDMNFIKEHNDSFVNGLKNLLVNVSNTITSNTGKPSSNIFDNDSMKTKLTGLKTALETFDASAIDEFSDALQVFTESPTIGESISNILQNAFIGKYKQAIIEIESVLDQ